MKSAKTHIIFWVIAAAIIIVDQLTKFLIRSNMETGQSITIIPKFLFIYFAKNTGAGFSLFSGYNSILIWVTLIILGAILFHYDKIINDRYYLISFALIMGGAIGNLLDRIFIGYVVDFIDLFIIFDHYPAFNLADTAITIGAVIILISLFRKDKK